MNSGPTIQTEGLLLRLWRSSNVEPYGRMLADPGGARFIVPGGPPVPSRVSTREHFAQFHN